MKVLGICVLVVQVLGLYSFIIPDELPSILSVIYSNIPTIKKGTDSRIGWGFRLGDRADFQVLVELGPQTNTQPLANQGDSGSNKRNTLETLANTLYAQRQKEKKIREEIQRLRVKENKIEDKENEADNSANSDGGQWLKTWSKSVNKDEEVEPLPLTPKPGLGIGEIDAKSVIPEDPVLEGREMRMKKLEEDEVKPSTEAYLSSSTTTQSSVSSTTTLKDVSEQTKVD